MKNKNKSKKDLRRIPMNLDRRISEVDLNPRNAKRFKSLSIQDERGRVKQALTWASWPRGWLLKIVRTSHPWRSLKCSSRFICLCLALTAMCKPWDLRRGKSFLTHRFGSIANSWNEGVESDALKALGLQPTILHKVEIRLANQILRNFVVNRLTERWVPFDVENGVRAQGFQDEIEWLRYGSS